MVPLVSLHCARIGFPFTQLLKAVESDNKNGDDKANANEPDSPKPIAPTLLQLLPTRERPEGNILDLNATFLDLNDSPQVEGCHSKEIDVQVYVRRSPRLRKAYDADRVTPVEQASRRVAATAPSSLASSASSVPTATTGDHRRSRQRIRKIGEVLQLPLKARPKPTSKAIIRELADLCGLKTNETIEEATKIEKAMSVGDATSNAKKPSLDSQLVLLSQASSFVPASSSISASVLLFVCMHRFSHLHHVIVVPFSCPASFNCRFSTLLFDRVWVFCGFKSCWKSFHCFVLFCLPFYLFSWGLFGWQPEITFGHCSRWVRWGGSHCRSRQ